MYGDNPAKFEAQAQAADRGEPSRDYQPCQPVADFNQYKTHSQRDIADRQTIKLTSSLLAAHGGKQHQASAKRVGVALGAGADGRRQDQSRMTLQTEKTFLHLKNNGGRETNYEHINQSQGSKESSALQAAVHMSPARMRILDNDSEQELPQHNPLNATMSLQNNAEAQLDGNGAPGKIDQFLRTRNQLLSKNALKLNQSCDHKYMQMLHAEGPVNP